MNDIVEVEDVNLIVDNIDAIYISYMTDLLKSYLRDHPENWECSFVKNIYTLIENNCKAIDPWLKNIMDDEHYRTRYIALKSSGRY